MTCMRTPRTTTHTVMLRSEMRAHAGADLEGGREEPRCVCIASQWLAHPNGAAPTCFFVGWRHWNQWNGAISQDIIEANIRGCVCRAAAALLGSLFAHGCTMRTAGRDEGAHALVHCHAGAVPSFLCPVNPAQAARFLCEQRLHCCSCTSCGMGRTIA